MSAAFPAEARLIASSRWPFARADMTEPGLVVWRLAEDMADLFEAGDDLSIDALVALGWPRHLVAQYFEPASQHSAALVAAKLFERRRIEQEMREAAPIPLEPESANDNAHDARERRSARFGELHALLIGMLGGGLIGALIAVGCFSLGEALQ